MNVWMSLSACTGVQAGQYVSVFYDHSGARHSEDSLDIVWNDEFQYKNFGKSYATSRGQEYVQQMRKAQRSYVAKIIQEHRGQGSASGRKNQPGLNDSNIPRAKNPKVAPEHPQPKPRHNHRKRTAAVSAHSTDESSEEDIPLRTKRAKHTTIPSKPITKPVVNYQIISDSSSDLDITSEKPATTKSSFQPVQEIKRLPAFKPESSPLPQADTVSGLSPNAIAGTWLLVSASNRSDRAPAKVPFAQCTTLDRLFQTLVLECNLKDRAASELAEVSATYGWEEGKRHLIRKAKPLDWTCFLEDIRKAWKKHSASFEEDGCEISLMVHVGV